MYYMIINMCIVESTKNTKLDDHVKKRYTTSGVSSTLTNHNFRFVDLMMSRGRLLVGISLLALLHTPSSFVEGRKYGEYYCSSIAESLQVSGNIFVQGEMGYDMATTQFASGAFPENIAPSVVVEAMSEEDVQAAVVFAGECGYTVSSRSAGHAYVGSSSCNSANGACMQIDVSNLNHTVVEGDLLLAGPGMTLRQMADVCLANEFHIPSGECAGVTLGGHFQTGGFGIWYVAAIPIGV